MRITRRSAIGILASTATATAMEQQPAAGDGAVTIGWLDGAAPGVETGVSWGVPWARGTVARSQTFALSVNDGKALPLQAWPLAYWPDGSIKFTGFATVTGASGPFRLAPGMPAAGPGVKVTQTAQAIDIDTGKLQCRVPKQGPAFIETMTIEGRVVARDGRLACTLEDRSTAGVLRFPEFTSDIKKVTVEQSGPVRAVVKIEGMHKNGTREWLPFTVRLYFYGGTEAVRLVHTIVFDGDQERDFIKGLGLAFAVPMREQVHNRHVRFAGEGDGLWSEPVQPATGRRPRSVATGAGVCRRPACGQAHRQQGDLQRGGAETAHRLGGVGLLQTGADHSRWVHDPEADQSAELLAGCGSRDAGRAGWCSPATCRAGWRWRVKNFWQSYPASLEVRHATSPSGRTARLALVARRARDGLAALRHPGARSGFQLRRRAAGLQHAARRGAHERDDAVPFSARCPPRRRPHCTRSWRSSRRFWWRRRSMCIRPRSSASGACRTGPLPAKKRGGRSARRGVRVLSERSGAAPLVRLLGLRRRDAPARWRAAHVALRYRRLRVGQHANWAPICGCGTASCAPDAPTSSAWRRR